MFSFDDSGRPIVPKWLKRDWDYDCPKCQGRRYVDCPTCDGLGCVSTKPGISNQIARYFRWDAPYPTCIRSGWVWCDDEHHNPYYGLNQYLKNNK